MSKIIELSNGFKLVQDEATPTTYRLYKNDELYNLTDNYIDMYDKGFLKDKK